MTVFLKHWLERIFKIILMGVVACATMDLWNVVLDIFAGIGVDWSLLGRWIGHIAQGDFMLYGVAASAAVAGESAIGWIAHYSTGVVYALIYLFVVYRVLRRKPTLLNAVLISLCFMVMPFCLYQPAVGMGYFASLAPDPNFSRIITMSMHISFGIGLYLGVLAMRHFHRILPFSKRDQ
jgi:hypothetical protein